jgi:hypothetical protein
MDLRAWGFEGVYDPAQQFAPYWWIYMRRPDGQTLRSGDGQFTSAHLWSLLTASYYQYPLNPGSIMKHGSSQPSGTVNIRIQKFVAEFAVRIELVRKLDELGHAFVSGP